MRRQWKSFRQIIVPLLSVFLLFGGITVPAAAEESDSFNTEPVNETEPETPGQENSEVQGESGTDDQEEINPQEETGQTEEPAVREENKTGGEEENETVSEEKPSESGNETVTESGSETEDSQKETEEETQDEAEEEELRKTALKSARRGAELTAQSDPQNTERTILFYLCGTDLETNLMSATNNLKQILSSNFSNENKIRFVVMTGGTNEWHIESDYLVDEDGNRVEKIDPAINQIWECYGADEENETYRSKMVLLSDQTGFSDTDLMTNYQNLINFINYGTDHYPSEKYDLILWDHGSGQAGAFANDQRADQQYDANRQLTAEWLLYAVKNNKYAQNGGRFEILNFDACLMGSLELLFAFSPYISYYVASALPIPSDGEEYSGWLNKLGESPDMDSWTLGKTIVDSFEEYYLKADEVPLSTVLSVIDVQKFLDSGILDSMLDMEAILKEEAVTPKSPEQTIEFYDELNSASNSLAYHMNYYRDFGHFVSQLGVAVKEVTVDDVTPEGEITDTNKYTNLMPSLQKVLKDPSLIYTKTTGDVSSDFTFYRDPDRNVQFNQMPSSGLSIFFPYPGDTYAITEYLGIMNGVLALMPGDIVKDALASHYYNMARYGLILGSGYTVAQMDDYGRKSKRIGEDEVITAEKVINWWMNYPDGDWNDWKDHYQNMYQIAGADGPEVDSWMEPLVAQQVMETVKSDDISTIEIIEPDGLAYNIKIEKTKKRAVQSIQMKIAPELPVLKEFIENNPKIKELADQGANFMISLGDLSAEMEEPPAGKGEEYLKEYIRWLNDTTSVWDLPSHGRRMYAVNDAGNTLHLAVAEQNEQNISFVPAVCIYEGLTSSVPVTLLFDNNNVLSALSFAGQDGNNVTVLPKDLIRDVHILLTNRVTLGNAVSVDLPCSENPFTVTAQNYTSVQLGVYDVDDIPDVHDAEGTEYKINYYCTVKNIYGYEKDITEQVIDTKDVRTHISCAEVQPAVFTGSAQMPVLKYLDRILQEGTDYEIIPDTEEMTDAGTYEVTLIGKGEFIGTGYKTFVINPAGIETVTADPVSDQVYTGNQIAPKPVLKLITPSGSTEEGNTETVYELKEGTDYTLSYDPNILPGTGKIKAAGIGNFQNDVSVEFTIVPCPIDSDAVRIEPMADQEYAGSPIEAKPTLIFNEQELAETADYTLAWSANTEIGTATVAITGKGNFSGTASTTFRITECSINSDKVTVAAIENQEYTSMPVQPKVHVTFAGGLIRELAEGTDYELSYGTNTAAGEATVTLTGIGRFSGERTETFRIIPRSMNSQTVTADGIKDQIYTGTEIRPKPVLKLIISGGSAEEGNAETSYVLKEGTDYTLSYNANILPGTGEVTAAGIGNFQDAASVKFTIVPCPIDSDAVVIEPMKDQEYTGSPIKEKPTLIFNGKELVENTDYTLAWSDNIKIGTATVTITGKGYFSGTAKTTFRITEDSIDSDKVAVMEIENQEYTGMPIQPKVRVTYADGLIRELAEGVDYELSYEHNTAAGKATVTIKGIGEFCGERTVTFEIIPRSINSELVVVSEIEDQEYTGGEIRPKPVLKLTVPEEKTEVKRAVLKAAVNESAPSGTTYVLKEGFDYTLSYSDNIVPGMAHVTVKGIGGFEGERTLSFTVTKCDMDSDSLEISEIEDQIYTGMPIEAKPSIHLGNKVLVEGEDYTLAWKDNVNIGTAAVTITGIGYFTGAAKTSFRIIQNSIDSDSVTVTGLKDQIYCGSPIKLKPRIIFEEEELLEGRDYELSWKDNTEPGTAVITITGIGSFGGERTETFTIAPCPIDSDPVWVYGLNDQEYTGKEIRLKPEVYVGRTRMREGADYTLRYHANVEPGNAVITIIAAGKRMTGSTVRTFRIVRPEEKKEEKKGTPSIPTVYYSIHSNGSNGSGTQIPNTCDTNNIMFWTCLHLLSLAGIAVSFLNLRRMKAEQ